MGKVRNLKRKSRSTVYSFDKNCGCSIHDNTQDIADNPLYRTNGKAFKKELKTWLIDNKRLTTRASYLCKGCIDYVKRNIQKQSEQISHQVPSKLVIDDEQSVPKQVPEDNHQDEITSEIIILIQNNAL